MDDNYIAREKERNKTKNLSMEDLCTEITITLFSIPIWLYTEVIVTDGTATTGDYTVTTPQTLQFDVDDDSQPLVITILKDTVIEDLETIMVELELIADSLPDVTTLDHPGTVSSATVFIQDRSGKYL